jgi:hypothetical protein
VLNLSQKYNQNPQLASNIIFCESYNNPNAYHFNKNKTADYSYWQINSIWKKTLEEKGWNIKDPQDNLEAGFYLLKTYGDHLWNWSRPCWGKTPAGWEN